MWRGTLQNFLNSYALAPLFRRLYSFAVIQLGSRFIRKFQRKNILHDNGEG